MGLRGQSYQILFNKGGYIYTDNEDILPAHMMVGETKNIDLTGSVRSKRKGTAKLYSTSYSSRLMGISDFIKRNGNQFLMAATADGKIYKDSSNILKYGMGEGYTSFEVFGDEIFITNTTGTAVPQTWDGVATSTSDITHPASDWGSDNNPSFFIKHGRGVSERLWALGCPSTPHKVYASANGDGKDFSDANVVVLEIETGDGYGITAAVEFGDRLICFGKKQAYIIDDSSSDTSQWGYYQAQWTGGAAHWRLVSKIRNDVIVMTEEGDIYSLTAVQSYGDYKAASIAKPAYIDRWIRDNCDLTHIDKFHMVYDPYLKALKIFVVRDGETEVDTALVYFINRSPEEGWMIYTGTADSHGYKASCSTVVYSSYGDYRVYTGDYEGYIWKLEETTKSDEGYGYYSWIETPRIYFENPRTDKIVRRGIVSCKGNGTYDLTVNAEIDGTLLSQKTISLADGNYAVLGVFRLGADKLGAPDISDKEISFGEKGTYLKVKIMNGGAGEDFDISRFLVDFKTLGSKPRE